MSRVQLALNVADLEKALAFYSTLFATEPSKVRPGYANFAIEDPPLKLVLIEDAARAPGSINHLGIEVQTTEEVTAAAGRLRDEGLVVGEEAVGRCCYALQDKVWVDGPVGGPWEIYTVLADTVLADTVLANTDLADTDLADTDLADTDVDGGGERGADARASACCSTRADLHVSTPR